VNRAGILAIALVIGVLGGCAPTQKKTRLTVDFQQGRTLKYKFLSSRDITIDWGKMGRAKGENKIEKLSESLELVVSYTPVEVDPYGLTTVKAVCESAKVGRTARQTRRSARPDAAESFAGKSWTFTVDATGKMVDRSELYDVIRQAGELAFRPDKGKGLIKEPDMLYDFTASQWFLWDSISSIPKPVAGVGPGEKWRSILHVPAPMILFAARDVDYQLEEIRQSRTHIGSEVQDMEMSHSDQNGCGRIAVIGGVYSLRYPGPSEWPVPYTEKFMMSGTFGFLRGYKILDLQGSGQELFNIDAGRTEQYTQKYTMHVQASLPMGLGGVNPQITIDQTLTAELLAPLAGVPKQN